MTEVAQPKRGLHARTDDRLIDMSESSCAPVGALPDAGSSAEPVASHRQVFAREPCRDWAWGPITGHRVSVVLLVTLLTLGLFAMQRLLWPHGGQADRLFDVVWSWGTVL